MKNRNKQIVVIISAIIVHIFSIMNCHSSEKKHVFDLKKDIPSMDVINKLPKDGGKEYNRLIFEKSPYLLQHAKNPVDWYAWGDEAFKKAKAENKIVFLSVGYSTCHWCHVMAHESFEDKEVADILNKNFISIKVDREERPDIDQVYMLATQMLTGSGGWPMSVFMTPERKPFFCGTYFPKSSKDKIMADQDLWKSLPN